MTYFESGGVVAPDVVSAMSPSEIRAGGFLDGRLAKLLRGKLPPLATAGPSLPGELNDKARRCFKERPEARVRLFVFYGVADVCLSLQPWITNSPSDWLEVRLVDLPGHGLRSTEPLPGCAEGEQENFDEAKLAQQRSELIAQLTDEIAAAAGSAPFALYGFSFGALIAYGIELELRQRGAANLPIALCVAGRGSAHVAAFGNRTAEFICGTDTDGMLAFQESGGNFSTSNIPKPMRKRAAELFRMGTCAHIRPDCANRARHASRVCLPSHIRDLCARLAYPTLPFRLLMFLPLSMATCMFHVSCGICMCMCY